MFEIHRVDRQLAEAVETLGTKPKFWFSDGERRMLFKAENRGTGEDWAEKIACHLCEPLGLPHVHYELAEEFGGSMANRPGVICENIASASRSLVLGNQLLLEYDPDYPASESRHYKVRTHTPAIVAAALKSISLPPAQWMGGAPTEVKSSLDVFVGYVMLDAWIANQDRHHENWGALQFDKHLWLAPTFDHGASLARNISDEERAERMSTNDQNRTVQAFVRRASSRFHGTPTDRRPLGAVAAFMAFAKLAPTSARVWLDRLNTINRQAVQHILDQVPPERMSDIAKGFTLQLLLENKKLLMESMG